MTDRIIVGVHHSGPTATAALFKNGALVAAAPEERFTRIKQDRSFPHQAIKFCLQSAGVGMADVTSFAIGWNPGENAALKYRSGYSDWMRYPGEWLASVPNHLLPKISSPVVSTESRFEHASGSTTSVQFIDHHQSHARLSYEYSGFQDCAVLVADGWSEQKVTTHYKASGGKLALLKSTAFPNSLGGYYAAITDFLGYKPFSDEWRVMGMAAYGDPSKVKGMNTLIEKTPEGGYELNLKYFDFYNFDRPRFFSEYLPRLLGPARSGPEELSQRHFDIAAAAQVLLEDVLTHLLTDLHRATGCDNVVLGGGVAMNCVYNGKVVGRTPFKRCYVPFAPDDSGNSIGAALETCRRAGQAIAPLRQTSALGKSFTDDEIGAALEKYKIRHRRATDVAAETARLLAEEKIVGWLQGRAEFGQRALGHRSIFASPKSAAMKDKVNASIKYRESYRPFAPMLLHSRLGEYFQAPDSFPVPFMEKAYAFRDEVKKKVPAVVHQDGTGRLQTVDAEEEPLVARVLNDFETFTGCPVLLNTSFNLNGEPVVNSPEDALRTYVTSGLDALVMGPFILEKASS